MQYSDVVLSHTYPACGEAVSRTSKPTTRARFAINHGDTFVASQLPMSGGGIQHSHENHEWKRGSRLVAPPQGADPRGKAHSSIGCRGAQAARIDRSRLSVPRTLCKYDQPPPPRLIMLPADQVTASRQQPTLSFSLLSGYDSTQQLTSAIFSRRTLAAPGTARFQTSTKP